MEDLVIGIDLGTTNSCVSLYRDGKTTVLENSEGGRITPSFVCYTTLEKYLVGEHGKRKAECNPKDGIYAIKRLVGRKFDKAYIQQHFKYLLYTLEVDILNNPWIVIKQGNTVLKKSPQEICSIILQKLKKDVEEKLEHEINKVVITVPAYFNVTQREVTLAAANAAGFKVLKLLNEPTAAALFYYFKSESNKTNYSLVYDLGGGTFDVAVLKKHENNVNILCVDGDTQLGGQDFDTLLVDYVSENLKQNYDFDPRSSTDDLMIVRNKCEEAKKALSFDEETQIVFIGFVNNHRRVEIGLKREEFENMANKLFQRTIEIVHNCVKSSGIEKVSIDDVIFSGGSTRIPKLRNMLSDYFDGKTLNKLVNPDECVAEGAAIQAGILSKNPEQDISGINVIDVIPLSLGINDYVDNTNFLIKRNTGIPASGTINFRTPSRNQSSGKIRIFEGERANVKDNRLLGEITISNLTPSPPCQCRIKIMMNVDENGILTVNVDEDEDKENSIRLKINYVKTNRSEGKIKNTVIDAEEHKEEDEHFRRFAKLKSYLLTYCEVCLYNFDVKNIRDKYRDIYQDCKRTKRKTKSLKLQDENIVKELIRHSRTKCEPIVKQHNFELMPQYVFD